MEHIVSSSTRLNQFARLWSHRSLIKQMVWREIAGRYQGSVLGLVWAFINPLFMLAVYTFVFSTALQSRWGSSGEGESSADFAAILFVGLIIHGLLSEVVGQAPALIVSNANYVKKVVFPLAILPIVSICVALFHAFVSFFMLVLVQTVVTGELPHVTTLFLPLILSPYVLLLLGLTWMLASIGVFFRDIGQVLSPLILAALFISPVFFPITSLPEFIRPYLFLNPISLIVEQVREVLIFGHMPNFSSFLIYSLVSLATAALGLFWFQKTRRGFADVL